MFHEMDTWNEQRATGYEVHLLKSQVSQLKKQNLGVDFECVKVYVKTQFPLQDFPRILIQNNLLYMHDTIELDKLMVCAQIQRFTEWLSTSSGRVGNGDDSSRARMTSRMDQ